MDTFAETASREARMLWAAELHAAATGARHVINEIARQRAEVMTAGFSPTKVALGEAPFRLLARYAASICTFMTDPVPTSTFMGLKIERLNGPAGIVVS